MASMLQESGDKSSQDEDKLSVKFNIDATTKSKSKEEPQGSEITIREFLDFLKTAYQVQDNIEGILQSEGMSDVVNWLELKENKLVKPNEIAIQTSNDKLKSCEKRDSKNRIDVDGDNVEIKRKLSEVLSEGILDSVLPYLVPSNASTCTTKKGNGNKCNDKNNSNASNTSIDKLTRRKSTDVSNLKPSTHFEPEVEIHVCDEVKNIKQNFMCNQKLLVEQMGYFAEVTAGQKLEDMDISVHCDIGIFDWLMRWVKREELVDPDRPKLDAVCAVPVLVSAAFLQMEPLLEECLLFCHEHMNEILKTSTSLSCLNDVVLTRLAAMYTNAELETIKDRRDKIQSKLFCKMIQSICEVEPESLRGHYFTMATVYPCKCCHQLISPHVEDTVPCVPTRTTLELDGALISKHIRDNSFNLTEYVLDLKCYLRTWRKVYWRLWGDAHFLFCQTCKRHFPARQVGWCRFHPDAPQYFTLDAQKSPLPVGRYPCCGERAYRFQLLEDFTGCKFKDHDVCTKEPRDASMAALLETYRNLIEEEPPELIFPERLTRLVAKADNSNDEECSLDCKEEMWWDGLEIMERRPKLGLLGVFDDSDEKDSEVDCSPDEKDQSTEDEFTSSSSDSSPTCSVGSEECPPPRTRKKLPLKTKKTKRNGKTWQLNMSARSNQDIQRTSEELALKDMTGILERRTATTREMRSHRNYKSWSRHVTPTGGIWMRLESEWRENNSIGVSLKTRHIYTGKTKTKIK